MSTSKKYLFTALIDHIENFLTDEWWLLHTDYRHLPPRNDFDALLRQIDSVLAEKIEEEERASIETLKSYLEKNRPKAGSDTPDSSYNPKQMAVLCNNVIFGRGSPDGTKFNAVAYVEWRSGRKFTGGKIGMPEGLHIIEEKREDIHTILAEMRKNIANAHKDKG